MGNPYVLATISAPENLAKLNRLVEINRRLADPRGLTEAEAKRLAQEGRAFYFVYGTIHSTEVGNTQSLIEIAHRLATDSSPEIKQILDNVVVLLVPSQNPDGQYLVVDHWYKTKGTPFTRTYPDLYHKYVGHDDNRDWFMFTQKETRLADRDPEQATSRSSRTTCTSRDPAASRIFVPPFDDPYDPNVHPIIAQGIMTVGQAMASALVSEGKGGVEWLSRYDLWAPARQYMVYHGQPRILTEIASVNLADPLVNANGAPMGPQEARWNFPLPYRKSDWRLRDIVDYGNTAAFAGMAHVAKYRTAWLENFYRIHADWVNRTEAPYAFVVPAAQRDPFETFEMLDILRIGEVEIHQAKAPFKAGGKDYAAGSWVIKTAQPYGAFAKTMLERQKYPDLRLYPGGPPKPPYDVTGPHAGDADGRRGRSDRAAVRGDAGAGEDAAPGRVGVPVDRAGRLPDRSRVERGVHRRREAAGGEDPGLSRGAGGAPTVARRHVDRAGVGGVRDGFSARCLARPGLEVRGADRAVAGDVYRLKPETRIGLWRGANNMPAGWMKWVFEQYRLQPQGDRVDGFRRRISRRSTTPSCCPTARAAQTIVNGLSPERNDKELAWAYGVGDAGWKKLGDWVRGGGTLVAIGSAVATARALLDLPIEPVLPERARAAAAATGSGQAPPPLAFFCPGSLLQNEFNTAHPVAFGMPASWPIFFEGDQAYRLKPGFTIQSEVVSRYPAQGPILQSGWLLGEDLLRDQANVVAFRVGKGYVVTLGSQVDFRAQPRATFKLLFNAMFHGPSTRVPASAMGGASSPRILPLGCALGRLPDVRF